MRLAERALTVLLSAEGRELLQLTAVPLPETPDVGFDVEDTDDMGLWCGCSAETASTWFLCDGNTS